MDKTKAIGAVLLLVAVVIALGWLWQVAQYWGDAARLAHRLVVLNTLALLAVLGLMGWIGYTMATMKVEVPAPPPPASPPPTEKKE